MIQNLDRFLHHIYFFCMREIHGLKYNVVSVSVNVNFSVNENILVNFRIFWRSSITFLSDLHT